MISSRLFSRSTLSGLALAGFMTGAGSAAAATFTWDGGAGNATLFGSAGYANWDADLVAANMSTGSNNDFIITNTALAEFFVDGTTNLGSITFTGSIPSAITLRANSASASQGFLRFYTAGTTFFNLADDYTGTVSVTGGPSNSGYLGVGLNYSGYSTIYVGNAAATLNLSGAINNNSGSGGVYGIGGLIKTGAGTLNLSTIDGQYNTFAGGIQILGGTVLINHAIDLGDTPAAPVANSVVIDGGLLRFDGTSTTASNVNRGFLLGSATIDVTAGSTYAIAGILGNVDGKAGSLTKTGAGTLRLTTSTNTFTGGIYILEGTLSTNSTLVLGAEGTQGITINGGKLLITDTIYSSSGRYYYLGENGGGMEVSGSNNFRILRAVSNVANQNGVLIKTGTGTLSLPSNNTYTGGTIVQAGTLRLVGGPTATLGGASSIAGLTLYGNFAGAGTINGPASYVMGGATVDIATYSTGSASAVTNVISALTFAGDLDISDAALLNIPTFKFDLGSTTSYDQIFLTSGALTIGEGFLGLGSFTFTAQAGFEEGGTYTLFSTTQSIVGSLLEGNLVGTVNGQDVTLALSGDGHSINLIVAAGTAIPEPSAWAALAGALALGSALTRRRARTA